MISFYFGGKMQEALKAFVLLTKSVLTNACFKRPKLRAHAFQFYVIDHAALFPISFVNIL